MQAEKHSQEEQRLQALYRSNILDTPDEPAFDGMTRLLARICDVPIAVINFVDRDRQWCKSEIGLGVRETPLENSLCAHAILQPGVFTVPDATKDERFCNNPLVTGDPPLRFYAGALLESSDGFPLGTLCVLDYKPRELTEEQQDTLLLLAKQVMAQIELRQKIQEVIELNARLERTVMESHHRIKNHFQQLTSLIELETPPEGESVAFSTLIRLKYVTNTLSLLNTYLTENTLKSSESILLGTPLEDIVRALQNIAGANRSIVCKSEDIVFPVERVGSFMLLVNELVSNAIKHGAGDIEVTLIRQAQNARLEVCDDGDGFPPDFDPHLSANIGLELIASFGRHDLGGVNTGIKMHKIPLEKCSLFRPKNAQESVG